MLILIVLFVIGMALGFVLRTYRQLAPWVERVTQGVVCVLMVVLGISVGANPQVMQNLASLGSKALALTIGAVAGSILLVRGFGAIVEGERRR